MTEKSRVYYRPSEHAPETVVVEKDGRELAVYKSTEQMIETHIKGLMAVDHEHTRQLQALFRKYRGD